MSGILPKDLKFLRDASLNIGRKFGIGIPKIVIKYMFHTTITSVVRLCFGICLVDNS